MYYQQILLVPSIVTLLKTMLDYFGCNIKYISFMLNIYWLISTFCPTGFKNVQEWSLNSKNSIWPLQRQPLPTKRKKSFNFEKKKIIHPHTTKKTYPSPSSSPLYLGLSTGRVRSVTGPISPK